MFVFDLLFFTAAFSGRKQSLGWFWQENMLFSASSNFDK
jgi:hypothetical protein